MNSEAYETGAKIIGTITFLVSWGYAVVTYGFFLGVGLGWIPSLVIAMVAALLWPLVAFALAILTILLIYAFTR